MLYTYLSKSLVWYFCGRLHKISHLILVKHINRHVQSENSVKLLDLRISQGSVAAYCRWGGMFVVWSKNFENRFTFAKVIIKHQV